MKVSKLINDMEKMRKQKDGESTKLLADIEE